MNDELERISKEAVMAQSICYSGDRVNGLSKTTQCLSHDSRYPVWDLNLTALEYKAVLYGD
jgi:hypothetical protein